MSNKNPNRVYTKEFVQETLKLVREENCRVGDVAKSLGLPHSTIHG
jgi:transposase-like protein